MEEMTYPWYHPIDGVARVGGWKIAASGAALIQREDMRQDFWVSMAAADEGVLYLAFELFDRWGRIDRGLTKDGIRKGTGVWETELDRGDILFFAFVDVSPQRRRQKIATRLVADTLEKAREKSGHFFAFARPNCLFVEPATEPGEECPELNEDKIRASENFWRSVGFRRVGTSDWLAFTDETSHPSRLLAVSEDWQKPAYGKWLDGMTPKMTAVMNVLLDKKASGSKCVRLIRKLFPNAEEARSWLDPVGTQRNTILHTAIVGEKAEAIAFILSMCPELADIANMDGYTPLERLQHSLNVGRRPYLGALEILGMRMPVIKYEDFEGFGQKMITCQAALKGVDVCDLSKLSAEDISNVWIKSHERSKAPDAPTIRATLRMKYGCTCGRCLGGFLSPRMLFVTRTIANKVSMQLNFDLRGDGITFFADGVANHLPKEVYKNLVTNNFMKSGLASLYEHIANCLKAGRLPTEKNILYLHHTDVNGDPMLENYLKLGGTVGAVVMSVFERAMVCDEWTGAGYLKGYIRKMYGDKLDALPVCRNDEEYGFVSGLCGYDKVNTKGFVDVFGKGD